MLSFKVMHSYDRVVFVKYMFLFLCFHVQSGKSSFELVLLVDLYLTLDNIHLILSLDI